MQNDKTKATLTAVVDVKAINYQNGNVFEAQGKITKADAGRDLVADENSLSFRGSDCEKPTMEVNYNSTSIGKGEGTTDVDLAIKGRVLTDRKEIVDVVESNAKLKTVFGGKEQIEKTEEWLKLKLENGCDAKCASTESYYNTKTSEVSA